MNVSEVMTAQVVTAKPSATITEVARTMAKIESGAVPVVDNDKVVGLITDRDIVLRVITEGRDPQATTVQDVVKRTEVVTIGADDPVEEALRTMKDHAVRRLPVIDGADLVGMVSQGDIATNYPEDKVGDLVEAISAAP